MEIELLEVAKRYRFEWIFKKINYHFEPQHRYAILGNNGTGKSTFLKILSGHLTPSKGKIIFTYSGNTLEIEEVYQHVACLLYTSPSPRDQRGSRMPSSA